MVDWVVSGHVGHEVDRKEFILFWNVDIISGS